jgi:hypothetical protein
MMIQATGKVAGSIVDGLKAQPLGLAVVVINVVALCLVGYALHEISERTEARDALITKLAQECKMEVPR